MSGLRKAVEYRAMVLTAMIGRVRVPWQKWELAKQAKLLVFGRALVRGCAMKVIRYFACVINSLAF